MFNKITNAVLFFAIFAAPSLFAEIGWYGKAGVSYAFPKDAVGNRVYSYDGGPGMQLGAGYNFEIFSIEGEYAYTWQNNDKVTDDSSNTEFATNGHQQLHALTVSALYHPILDESFSPYLGFGLGYGMVSWDSSRTDNGIKDDATTSVIQFMVGSSYEISEQIALNFEYRSVLLGEYTIDDIGDIDTDRSNKLLFSVIYRFR